MAKVRRRRTSPSIWEGTRLGRSVDGADMAALGREQAGATRSAGTTGDYRSRAVLAGFDFPAWLGQTVMIENRPGSGTVGNSPAELSSCVGAESPAATQRLA